MLEKRQRIGHKDHQSSPFKPALLTVVVAIEKKTNFSSEFFYGPSFFHEETKKRENLHVMKKQTLSLSVQLCLVRCEKIQNRDSPESKKKSGHSPLKKVQVWLFLSERKSVV